MASKYQYTMNLLKKIIKVIFIISYIFLLLWFFSNIRFPLPSFFGNWLEGFFQQLSISDKRYIPVQIFRPESELVPTQMHIPEFPLYPVVEFHGHIFRTPLDDLRKGLEKNHIQIFVDLALNITTLQEYENFENQLGDLKNRILIFPGLNWKRLQEKNSYQGILLMARDLEMIARRKSIKGIKIWKDFGLMKKKPNGTLWRLDDPAFDPIWKICRKYKLIVAIHTGDPPAFFRPIDEHNERLIELSRRPEWSFYGKEYPAFKEILQQRENLFRKWKDIIFVALHFGEFAHDLKKAEHLLTTYPNVYLDIAQRIDELGRQPYSVRKFLIRFQDRILYGTDGPPDYPKAQIYWRFLETQDEYFDYHPSHKPVKGLWKIYGIHLPPQVLEKIYYKNAFKILNLPDNRFR